MYAKICTCYLSKTLLQDSILDMFICVGLYTCECRCPPSPEECEIP